MEKIHKLLQHLAITVSSLVLVFFLSGCFDKERTLEWSVHNCFDDDVELFVYSNNENFATKLHSPFTIEAGDSTIIFEIVMLRGGSSDFTRYIDSAKVKTVHDDIYIAIWRKDQEPIFAEGYDIEQDFFDWTGGDTPFHYMLVYSEDHVKFRFYLSNEEQ
ncbi:MAG: hypothetical protein RBT74_02720 [Tenuifilaceae bacterium]|nr:hypothetical protein [Tenuifilaceae bacterium]